MNCEGKDFFADCKGDLKKAKLLKWPQSVSAADSSFELHPPPSVNTRSGMGAVAGQGGERNSWRAVRNVSDFAAV